MEHHLVKRQFLQSYQTCFIPLSSTNASNWALEFMDPKLIFLYRQKNYFLFCPSLLLEKVQLMSDYRKFRKDLL